jgi:hypothetical protein
MGVAILFEDLNTAKYYSKYCWWAAAINREEWRKLLKEAKTVYEL